MKTCVHGEVSSFSIYGSFVWECGLLNESIKVMSSMYNNVNGGG